MIDTIIDAVVYGTIYFALFVIIVYGAQYLYEFYKRMKNENLQ